MVLIEWTRCLLSICFCRRFLLPQLFPWSTCVYHSKPLPSNTIQAMPYQLHDPHVLVAHIHYNVYTSCYSLFAITYRSPYRDGRMCRGTWSARKTSAWSYEAWVYNFRPPPSIRTQRTNKARVRLVLVPHLVVEERCAFTYMVGFSRIIDR